MGFQELGNRDAVGGDAVDGEVRGKLAPCAGECSSSAGLIPLDDREVFFPGEEVSGKTFIGYSGASVNHQDNWIVAVPAANGDPLIGAVDLDEHGLVDAVGRVDGQELFNLALPIGAVDEARCECSQQDRKGAG